MTPPDSQPAPATQQLRETERSATAGFRVQTGLRAGDIYLQKPPGSNNRLGS